MLRVEDSVAAGLYDSPGDVIRDALRSLTQMHPEYRIEIAVARYRAGDLSVARAAQLAGVSALQMMEILHTRGVVAEAGPADMADAREEVEALRSYLDAGRG
ncbi:MAG: UPF0175 family protein [Armatimonadetes bacterium]|nr:UPF0175 family protein [Armatimonadota bacterium]